jgi:type I restriction enzyme R subunit
MFEQERLSRRDLPHWDVPGATYFVTSCLDGSIPARGLLDLYRFQAEERVRKRPEHVSAQAWELFLRKRMFARVDSWLDHEPAVRHLADPQLAEIVVNAMLFFAGARYDLLAFVIMPSHFHWVFLPREQWVRSLQGPHPARERIMKSLKGYTGTMCNRHRGIRGTFWQAESYDHWIRDVEELERIIHYVENNPVQARLVSTPEEWRFSSAWLRKQSGRSFGEPLLPLVPIEPYRALGSRGPSSSR